MRRRNLRWAAGSLACVGLLLAAAPVFGQGGTFGNTGGNTGANTASSFGGNAANTSSGSAFGGSNSAFGGNSVFGGNTMTGGNSVFGGNTMTGGTPGATPGTATGRTGTTQIGATSFLGAHYANPLALGLANTTGTTGTTQTNAAFGNPLYTLTTSRTGTATVTTPNLQNSQFGAGVNVRRLPAYATTLKIKDLPPPPTAAQVQTDLQTMLTASPQLDARDSVRVLIDGQAVVLQGQVVDDDERRLVENMVRLSPGVYQVRNELTARTP